MKLIHFREQSITFSGEEGIGFLVAMTTPETTVPEGQTVIWESHLSNIGDAFQPETGEFLCPANGLYHFTVTATTANHDGSRAELVIMHNGKL